MNKKNFYKDGQFIMSHEIIWVLFWILKYKKDDFSKLIDKACIEGVFEKFEDKIDDIETNINFSKDLEDKFLDFFIFLENKIIDLSNIEFENKNFEKNFSKFLKSLKGDFFESGNLKSNIFNLTKVVKSGYNSEKAKDRLLKELLKEWDPKFDKNNLIN